MARLATSGFESQRLTSSAFTTGERTGLGAFSVGTVTMNTTVVRSGLCAASMAQNANNYVYVQLGVPMVLDRAYYTRGYFRFSDATPSTAAKIITVVCNAIDVITVTLSTGGKLQLYDANAAQVGSDSATTLANDIWYRIEMAVAIPTAGLATVLVYIDGTQSLGALGAVDVNNSITGGVVRMGNISGGQAGVTTYLDDVAINDNTGATTQISLPGPGKILLALPVSDSAVGTGWEAPQTAGSDTTAIYDALDNIPPVGVAHSDVDANNLKYIFNANSTVPSSYDANVQSYTAAGLPGSGRVRVAYAYGRYSTADVTGTHAGQISLVSNPAISAATINFDESGSNAGTEPTGWLTRSSSLSADPSITAGTSPVVRITKTTSGTVADMIDLLGVMFEYDVVVVLGQASETDSVLAITRNPLARLIGQASETEVPQALTPLKTRSVAQVSEADTAQPVDYLEARLLGQSVEADTAQAVTALKAKALGQASETDTAGAIDYLEERLLGQPSETDTAQALTAAKALATGQASETDTAQAVDYLEARLLGLASESDASQALAALKTITLGQASEVEVAQAIDYLEARLLGLASEADAAQVLTALKTLALGQASETDTAQVVDYVEQRLLGLSSETDEAGALTAAKALSLGQASETDEAQPITRAAAIVPIGQSSETDEAQALTALKQLTSGQAEETDEAQPLTHVQVRVLGQSSEVDEAQFLYLPTEQHIAVEQVLETDSALAFTSGRFGAAFETDTAQPLTALKTRALGQSSESDLARPIVGFKTQAQADVPTTLLVNPRATVLELAPGTTLTLDAHGSALSAARETTLTPSAGVTQLSIDPGESVLEPPGVTTVTLAVRSTALTLREGSTLTLAAGETSLNVAERVMVLTLDRETILTLDTADTVLTSDERELELALDG